MRINRHQAIILTLALMALLWVLAHPGLAWQMDYENGWEEDQRTLQEAAWKIYFSDRYDHKVSVIWTELAFKVGAIVIAGAACFMIWATPQRWQSLRRKPALKRGQEL